jgi:hypothetical protein
MTPAVLRSIAVVVPRSKLVEACRPSVVKVMPVLVLLLRKAAAPPFSAKPSVLRFT